MPPDNEKLEHYLKEFRPRAVRNLELSREARSLWLRRIAAAAMVVCCFGASYWQMRRARLTGRAIKPKSQLYLMTRIGLQDRGKLDEFLFDQSRNVLPSFQGENSTLRVLAKE
jgi:hypothetical protein